MRRTPASERLNKPPRANAPPGVGDRLFAAIAGRDTRVEASIVSISNAKDGARLLCISRTVERGTAFYNAKGHLVAIARGTGKAPETRLAVYLPERMPGDWVETFPARPEDPVAISPPDKGG